MANTIKIDGREIGPGQPVYFVGEIGINHNGSLDIADRLIDTAKVAGVEAVKFQKRTPDICVPLEQREILRETPWGTMTYLNYRHRIEFGEAEYRHIANYCRQHGMTWFASPWDEPSVDFLETFDVAAYKIPSAAITDQQLLRRVKATGGQSSCQPAPRLWMRFAPPWRRWGRTVC